MRIHSRLPPPPQQQHQHNDDYHRIGRMMKLLVDVATNQALMVLMLLQLRPVVSFTIDRGIRYHPIYGSSASSSLSSSFIGRINHHHECASFLQQLQQQQQQQKGTRISIPTTRHGSSNHAPWTNRIHHTTLLSSYNPLLPMLKVGLDQPLYPPVKQAFWNVLLSQVIAIPYALRGMMAYINRGVPKMGQIISSTISTRFFRSICLLTISMLAIRFLYTAFNQVQTNIAIKNAVPMPFKETVNDGWSICHLQSIQKYGKTSSLLVNLKLPDNKYVLQLDLGQPVHICGLDGDNNAIQAECYPFHETAIDVQRSGTVTLLLPDPNNTIIPPDLSADIIMNNNDIQKVRVAQLLQDYIKTGDTELAIHPGMGSKLQYRGTDAVQDIYYLVIGSTGIIPVLDQIRTVLSTANRVVESISIVRINSSMNEFDKLSDIVKEIYESYSTELLVVCGIETNLLPSSNNSSSSSMTQDIAIDYFYKNNDEINETIVPYTSGKMMILSIENDYDPYSSQFLRNGAVKYLQEQKQYPMDCICVL